MEFAHTNLRKQTEATMEPHVLDPNPKKWRTEQTTTQKLGIKIKIKLVCRKEAKGAIFEFSSSVRTC